MAKYDVTAEVTITTSIEPQGYIDDPRLDGVEDFEADGWSGYPEDISDTCRITLVYETDTDEDFVTDEIRGKLDGQLSYESDDVEWEISDIEILSCDRQQLSVGEAVQIVRTFLDSREDAFREHHPRVHEALETLLQQF